ncbi:MAG: hypothetical protein QME06_05600 [Desulfobacterales bacterium]|nr:hypothetical protein [Desulfobacterales bacterium]
MKHKVNTDYRQKINFDAVIAIKLYQTIYNIPTDSYSTLEEDLFSKSDMHSVSTKWQNYFSKPKRIVPEFEELAEDTYSENPFKVENTLSILISKGIVILEPAIVMDYLSEYPEMIDLMSSACMKAKETFDEDTQLSLEYYSDHEIDDRHLTLYVRQTKYDEHILDIIDDIRAAYEYELSSKSGWFHITTDFQKPR